MMELTRMVKAAASEVHEALPGSQKANTSWVEACLHMNLQAVACANAIMRYICMG